MRKVFIKGYINYDNENYTFIYEDEKLTLISVENHQTFFNEYKYVDEFIGFTVDGFDIVFYINNSIETEESTVFALLYPLIHAGQRVGDFYKKEASKEKNPWPIQLDEKQKKELDSKMELKILSSIDKNFQVLEKTEKQEKVNRK